MAINAIHSSAPQDSGELGSQTKVAKEDFLRLLTTQLQHQDPLNPADQEQMLSTLAQFSTLEQMTNLNSQVTQLTSTSGMGDAVALLGKTVKAQMSDVQTLVGVVDRVTSVGGVPQLVVDGQFVNLKQVIEIR